MIFGLLYFLALQGEAAVAPLPPLPPPVVVEQTPLSQSEAEKTSTVEVVYTTPGCFTSGSTHMRIAGWLTEEYRGTKTHVSFGRLSLGVLQARDRILIPEPFGESNATQTFLVEAAKLIANGVEIKREVVREDVAVLVSPWEMVFQSEGPAPDLLKRVEDIAHRRRPAMVLERKTVDIVRYRAKDATVLAIETAATRDDPLVTDRSSYIELPTFETDVRTDDDQARLIAIGKRHGTPAMMKATLDAVFAQAADTKGVPLRIHPGGGPAPEVEGHVEQCGKTLESLHYDAIGVRAAELDLGADGLLAFAKQYNMPFVAANLRVASTKERPFPRFLTFDREGITVAVIGIVGPQSLDQLPAASRNQWTIEPFRPALEAARVGLRERLGRDPDLVIVLGAMADSELPSLSRAEGVDIVLARYGRYGDHVAREEVVRVERELGGREAAVLSYPLLAVDASPYGVGRLSVDFEPRPQPTSPEGAAPPPMLREIRHRHTAAIYDRSFDDDDRAFARPNNAILGHHVDEGGATVLPNLSRYLDVPGVKALVFGDRVLTHFGYRERLESDVPSFSDPLWMRVVTNIMREELDADFAISRNLRRGDDVSGPLPRAIVESWLPTAPQVLRVELKGAQVFELLAALKRENSTSTHPRLLLFTAGVDVDGGRIAGRQIDPKLRYTVAVTDDVVADSAFSGIFGKALARTEHWAINAAGATPGGDTTLPLRTVVFHALEKNVDTAGRFREERDDAVRAWLTDDTDTLYGQWRLAFEELSLSASGYRNSPNIGLFGESRETRATTPNLFQLGLSGRISATYDGPLVAWETGANAQYSGILLDIEGVDLPLQEQRDDALLYTEGRLNLLRLSFFDDKFQAVPFARLAIDSEFTPTAKNPNDAAAGTFPHQVLFQQSVGAALFVTPVLKELRIGLLVQEDFSELTTGTPSFGAIHYDVGLQFAYRLTWPVWFFVFDSTLDMRYLAPDPDDRVSDLSLRLQAVNKLIVPLSDAFSVFTFVDLFVLNGKLDANRSFAASAVVGAGVSFNRLFSF